MAHIESLSPSQQLELVEARQAGSSYRDLEKLCLDRFGMQVTHETIRNYFDHALATMPKDVRDLKASAIIELNEQIGRYKKLITDMETLNNEKGKFVAYSDMTKLLLGIISLKPDMPMPTGNATPSEAILTEKKMRVVFAKEPGNVVEGSVDD